MAPDDNWLTAVFERERWQLPPKPGEVERILGQVARRRRRRLLLRSVVAGLAAVAIGAASAVLVLRQGTSADEGSSLLGQPQTTGPIPQPRVVRVGSVPDLTAALPGTAVKELNYRMAGHAGQAGRAIVPQGVTESGNLLAMVTSSGGAPDVVELDPATGKGRTVAKAKLPELRSASVFRATIVWTETAKATGNPDTDADLAVVYRCTNRGSGSVQDLALPRHDPAGLGYEQGYAGISVGSGGIAVEMARHTGGSGPNPSDDFDLYLATDCGAPLRLIAARASSAQFFGDWLFYLHDGAIWRQNLRARSASALVIDKAESFQLTDDALVWTDAVGSVMSTLHAARPDGGFARTIPVPETWRFAYASNAVAVAGTIEKAKGFRSVLTGVWIYLPSRGVIVVFDRPNIPIPDSGEQPAAAVGLGGGAAGKHVLLSEYGWTVGSTVASTNPTHEWLVRFP
ncbi:MAG TPA: hypothetical protein VGS60_08910 [Actinomycetes bacterium]|jgi:hypothetical protein|nr:hypothetical protein [Actinomycetes bacterium]